MELHSIFDRTLYGRSRSDAQQRGVDLLSDYLEQGWRENIDPHRLFDEAYYQRWNRVGAAGLPHYLIEGEAAGAWPNSGFDPDWYAQNAGLGNRAGALADYIRRGAAAGLAPHPLIDPTSLRVRHGAPAWSGLADKLAIARETGTSPYDPPQATPSSWAVVVHVFYPDLLEELARQVERLPSGGDLFVTAPSSNPPMLRAIVARLPHATVLPCSDHGRDIAPLLELLPRLIQVGYRAVLKLHTKRGQTEPDAWRYAMIEPLVAAANAALAGFERDPRLSIIGPRAFYLSGPMFIGPNGPALQSLVGDDTRLPDRWGFFAGTMFWFRPQALAPMLAMPMKFDGANSSHDGLLEHAVERLFGLMAGSGDHRIGLIDLPGEEANETDLTFRRAPGPLIETELADTLPEETRRLWAPLRKLKIRHRRLWTPPDGECPTVTLIGPVGAQHGLGVSARGYVQALRQADVETSVHAWTLGFERVRTIESVELGGPPGAINLVHLNLDLLATGRLLELDPLRQMVSDATFNVVIVSWELQHVPYEWLAILERFDEVWVASTFTQRALAAVTHTPVRVVRPTIAPRGLATPVRRKLSLPEDRFLFCYVADMGSVPMRKNPVALLQAYIQAFALEDGAACLLKLHYPMENDPAMEELTQLARGRLDVRIMTQSLDGATMDGLFNTIDCYVSPHRSEGVGLTIVEAMLAGKPVIATRFGGVEDFVTANTACSPAHRLIQVGDDAAPYPAMAIWADPQVSSLAGLMRGVFDDPQGAAVMAAKGRLHAETLFGPAATGVSIGGEIERIWHKAPSKPARV